MHPILFQMGPVTLRTYGVLIALAFLAALQVAKGTTRRRVIRERILLDLTMVLVISGLVGARLFYVLLNASYYRQQPLEALRLWEGGLVFYGGFLAAALAGVVYLRRQQESIVVMADCLAPALAVGQAVGRWGCFFAGCCYGAPTRLAWGVTYTDPAALAPLHVPLHPAQIYESLGDLVIAGILWRLVVKCPHSRGQIFWTYVLLYGILRFGVELLRGDDRGPLLAGFYPSQIMALGAVLLSGSILMARAAVSEKSHGSMLF